MESNSPRKEELRNNAANAQVILQLHLHCMYPIITAVDSLWTKNSGAKERQAESEENQSRAASRGAEGLHFLFASAFELGNKGVIH